MRRKNKKSEVFGIYFSVVSGAIFIDGINIATDFVNLIFCEVMKYLLMLRNYAVNWIAHSLSLDTVEKVLCGGTLCLKTYTTSTNQ